MKYEVHHSDCLAFMRTLPDNHVDAIVTDPPYELGFMGKGWDKSGIANSVEMWSEALRVLKPGGHLLAFSGSRTYHRMTCAIEDAGFEVRDQIMWLYGSGFPKSMDVSKAIDKMDAAEEQQRRRFRFTEWVRSQGVTAKQIDEATGTCMGNHYTTHPSQPAIMTREHLDACRHLLGSVPEWVERECDIRSVESRNMAEREVVGQQAGNLLAVAPGQDNDRSATTLDITAPATDAARQWQGWGTALKPAHEPICVARKPLIGTVAENVLTWGTGGVNVDGCRVGTGKRTPGGRQNSAAPSWLKKHGHGSGYGPRNPNQSGIYAQIGRWPANVIHDGSDEATDGMGEASRYFYCAKASKTDRGNGNMHPTVKPTDLMRYLCRLVTPPNGLVFDPFTGSGSTGKAAILEGFDFLGCDMTAEYVDIARARIEHALKTKPNELF